MSACGWPEPSTGIRLPRGQCEHSWRRRVSWFSSRIARSRYFSWISSSVVGKGSLRSRPPPGAPDALFDEPGCPPADAAALHQRLPRLLPAAPAAARLDPLQRLDVDQVAVLADDVGGAHRLQELLRAVEVVDPDHHAAEALGDVAVGAGAGDDPVLGGEPLRLLVERRQRDPRVEDLEDVDLLDDVQQVLVVRDRVQPVERMRHVDEAALAADLGDRLRHRHPALDLLGEEEADHLALLGGLDLLGDDHLDPDLVGDLARLERAGDLVVVGDRDRPQALAPWPSPGASAPASRSRGSGRCACGGRRGCACAARSACAPPASPRRVVAAGGEARVDLLDLVRHRAPVARCARAAATRSRFASAASVASRSSWPGERDRVARGEQQPGLAVPRELLVDAAGARRPGPCRSRARRGPGQGPCIEPPDATQTTSAAAISSSGANDRGPTTWTRSRSRLESRTSPPVRQPHRRLPVERSRKPPQRAQEQAQRAPLLLEAERDPERLPRRLLRAAASAIRPPSRPPRARPARSRRGSSAASGRPSGGSSRCARRAGRRRPRPAGARPASTAHARTARGSCRR